jgi:ribosomal protein S18 acetylase RimI-like enzyme
MLVYLNMPNEIITISGIKIDDAESAQEIMYRSSISVYLSLGCSNEVIENKFKDRSSIANITKQRKTIESLSSNERFMLARQNGIPVGLCYVERQEKQNYMHALYIVPEYQNQGIAMQLWNHVHEWVTDKDVYLVVLEGNTPAVSFYEKIGFIKTGKRIENHDLYRNDGTTIFDIEMKLVQHT